MSFPDDEDAGWRSAEADVIVRIGGSGNHPRACGNHVITRQRRPASGAGLQNRRGCKAPENHVFPVTSTARQATGTARFELLGRGASPR